jgi:hypothetical protein
MLEGLFATARARIRQRDVVRPAAGTAPALADRGMSGPKLVLVLSYRKAGHLRLPCAAGRSKNTRPPPATRWCSRSSAEAAIAAIGPGLERAGRVLVLVLWSFYSPDPEALAAELAAIKAAAPGALHVAGGVHATAEPVQTLDAGWDIAAVGEGETTLLALADARGGRPASPA